MAYRLPDVVAQARPHSLLVVPGEAAVVLYLREDEFTAARYPPQCSPEFQLPVWDDGRVMCVTLLVRLGGSDAGTFEYPINVADPNGLRLVQLLAAQATLELFLVTERVVRSFRRRNALSRKAAQIVASVRTRKMWTAQELQERRKRLDTLYPTSAALWRGARELKK